MTDPTQRPDPDELLSRITQEEREEEVKSTRGKFKVFFGACAGVGKTYAMLSAGQDALKEGRNVVIGVVETHGRTDTEKLLDGMPTVARKEIEYKGTTINEMDIDALLECKPELALVDELAHSNAPGSRHPKRWQDVEELLDAGIDIYTTINVQHIESLNDVVARITGIWVKETVPDAFFDTADAISLVDIPTEELLKRLSEGKVYIAPGAKQRAAQNFFRTANLIALRELALRRTAERVDAQMDDYKSTTGAAEAWSGADRILVCIGPDELSTKLVRVAKRTAGSLKAPWVAVYLENERHYRLSKNAQESVERTLRLAERMGGSIDIIQGSHAARDIIAYARDHGITKIVVGKKTRSRFKELMHGTLADHIIRMSNDIDVYVVTGDEEKADRLTSGFHMSTDLGYLLSAPLVVAAATMLAYPVRHLTNSVNFTSLYFMAMVTVAVRYGRIPALVTALLSALAFNFFIQKPYHALSTSNPDNIIILIVMILTGLVVGAQSYKLRMQAFYSRQREKTTAKLYALTRELATGRGKQKLAEITAVHVDDILSSNMSLWLPSEQDELKCFMSELALAEEEDRFREESAARWAFSHKSAAGLGTQTLPTASGYYIPLNAGNSVIGVLGIVPSEDQLLTSEKITLLETIGTILATTIERANSAELVEKTLLESESEKLRNILLSSVSHDLRTPLASISGAASTMLLEGQKITPEYRDELLRLVHEEAARLARMVTNLLDVTSLQTGTVKLNKELYFIEELVGSALMRVESRLGSRRVNIDIQQGLPLVKMDGLLIEQVLINLFENVSAHTPEGTQVTVSAEIHKPDLHIIMSDDGPGLTEGDEEKVFDRFYAAETDQGGKDNTGMGLAICRGIVKAHEGKIWAQNNEGKGARVTFTIPLRHEEELT